MKFSVFPHFSRIFSATLWLSLIALLSINITTRFGQTSYWKEHVDLLINPNSLDNHLALAQTYWQHGDWPKTQTELLIAQTLYQSSPPEAQQSKVLGANSSPLDLLHQWAEEPARLTKELQFWQTVMKEKPDYRDAYLQASALSYQLNRLEDARQYLDQATALDPNFPIASHLTQLLSSR